MAIHEQNPYEPSGSPELSRRSPERKPRHTTILILVFELPAVLLILDGLAYLFDIPGAEVVVNEYGGMQPIAFTFFRIVATGGLLVPLAICCWLSATTDSSALKFGAFVGISYIVVSLAWWMLIVLGIFTRNGNVVMKVAMLFQEILYKTIKIIKTAVLFQYSFPLRQALARNATLTFKFNRCRFATDLSNGHIGGFSAATTRLWLPICRNHFDTLPRMGYRQRTLWLSR